MAHTVELLALINDYPEAFVEPAEAPVMQTSSKITASSETEGLMSLISEFPEAFAEPEEIPSSADKSHSAQSDAVETPESKANATTDLDMSMPRFDLPQGYRMALHQTISTFGWGQVEAHLRYDEQQILHSVWLQVGKSGTEVQSFCEAIARLMNRLLAANTPIVEIVKELRGIRGGDSEGLGPHRFLGLVDLFGKILQEAPETLSIASVSSDPTSTIQFAPVEVAPSAVAPAINHASDTPTATSHPWVELSDTSAIASLCPECGAELQQVNGCSGGACVVCGYSSCS